MKTLPFYKNYFGIAYPLPKMDLIAIADFMSGNIESYPFGVLFVCFYGGINVFHIFPQSSLTIKLKQNTRYLLFNI